MTATLAYRPPYDVARMLRFLSQRAIPGIEVINADALRPGVRRTLRPGVVSPCAGWIEAQFLPDKAQVRLRFSGDWAPDSARVLAAARRWLDLDAAPQAIDAALIALPGDAGLRLPGSLDAFELAVRAVLGQQVTVAGARTLARRVVERFGDALPAESASPWPDLSRSFPQPCTLAAAPVERIAELGIIRTRAAAIIALAQAWPEIEPLLSTAQRMSASRTANQPTGPLIERLCALPGIGPWTAHYIAMRALSWPDAFPPNDVAVLKAMQRLFGTPGAAMRQREADTIAQAWQPWRSYAVLRLWNSLELNQETLT